MPDTLTPGAVLAMPSGEALDELVATRVLCWELKRHMAGMGQPCWYDQTGRLVAVLCPLLSQSLGSAEYILDWLRERWGGIDIVGHKDGWMIAHLDIEGTAWPPSLYAKLLQLSPTLPLALCRAALLEALRTEGK